MNLLKKLEHQVKMCQLDDLMLALLLVHMLVLELLVAYLLKHRQKGT